MPEPTSPPAGLDDLRDRIAEAIDNTDVVATYEEDATVIVSAVWDVVRPELDRLREDVELQRQRAEGAEQRAEETAAALSVATRERADARDDEAAAHGWADGHRRDAQRERQRAEQAEQERDEAAERVRDLARHPRTSMGRVNGYVLAADVLAALDPPAKEET